MEHKNEFQFFTIFEYDKEQDYLRKMHKSGWKFVTVTGIGTYHFEKCEPEDVIYQLDYHQDSLNHRTEYLQMFRDCGWEYLQDFFGYSYFRKPVSEMNGNEEEIFCDDNSRLEMIDRIFKGRLLPLLILFFLGLVPQFVLQISKQNYSLATVIGAIIIFYVVIFATYAVKRYQYKKKIDQ